MRLRCPSIDRNYVRMSGEPDELRQRIASVFVNNFQALAH